MFAFAVKALAQVVQCRRRLWTDIGGVLPQRTMCSPHVVLLPGQPDEADNRNENHDAGVNRFPVEKFFALSRNAATSRIGSAIRTCLVRWDNESIILRKIIPQINFFVKKFMKRSGAAQGS